jgi:hypothetical protein
MSGIYSIDGEMRNEYKILVGETYGKRPFGRVWRSLEDNIKMDGYGMDSG